MLADCVSSVSVPNLVLLAQCANSGVLLLGIAPQHAPCTFAMFLSCKYGVMQARQVQEE